MFTSKEVYVAREFRVRHKQLLQDIVRLVSRFRHRGRLVDDGLGLPLSTQLLLHELGNNLEGWLVEKEVPLISRMDDVSEVHLQAKLKADGLLMREWFRRCYQSGTAHGRPFPKLSEDNKDLRAQYPMDDESLFNLWREKCCVEMPSFMVGLLYTLNPTNGCVSERVPDPVVGPGYLAQCRKHTGTFWPLERAWMTEIAVEGSGKRLRSGQLLHQVRILSVFLLLDSFFIERILFPEVSFLFLNY